ncbi:GntR family transcriptional regulator [Nitratidesulfovibrio liaohensis]|uniref:GntR family transcriptional regulator n=1 Tax=Nitratidesulfovibrio liaohensis TaxID=2604158 RepID=A0ABY9R0F9_9BACT|nr:GntR family transcriptional regulator [Nitratidesulfovibrio liaohensis]WMW65261.1 GntR family transcriptional regulator [Nitratidesulfovibrio liaohensis]
MKLPAPPTATAAPDGLAVIRHENLDEKVYERIRAMIADGVLAPGQRVAQETLATCLGVSRTPLVNALKRLAQDGLLRAIPRRGFRVRELSTQELVQLFELRERLEPLAAELAALRISPDEAERMADEWRAMASLPDTPEAHQAYIERDRAFHRRLAELSGNPFLRAAMDPVSMLAAAYLHGTPRPWEDTVPDHLAVIEALRRGDPAASGAAMRNHIAPSLAVLRQALAEAETPDAPISSQAPTSTSSPSPAPSPEHVDDGSHEPPKAA